MVHSESARLTGSFDICNKEKPFKFGRQFQSFRKLLLSINLIMKAVWAERRGCLPYQKKPAPAKRVADYCVGSKGTKYLLQGLWQKMYALSPDGTGGGRLL